MTVTGKLLLSCSQNEQMQMSASLRGVSLTRLKESAEEVQHTILKMVGLGRLPVAFERNITRMLLLITWYVGIG